MKMMQRSFLTLLVHISACLVVDDDYAYFYRARPRSHPSQVVVLLKDLGEIV
jgi:hypothetical protein